MEYRSFPKDGKIQVKYQRSYYHVRKSCILDKNDAFTPNDIYLEDAGVDRMDNKQRRLFNQEFGLHL